MLSNEKISNRTLFAYTSAVSAALIFLFFSATVGFDKNIILNSLPQIVLGLIVGCLSFSASLLCFAIGAMGRSHYKGLLTTTIGLTATVLALASVLLSMGALGDRSYFAISAMATIIQAYAVTKLGVHFMQLGGEWPMRMATIGTVFTTIMAVGFAFSERWLSSALAAQYLRLSYCVSIAMLPLISLCIMTYIDKKAAPKASVLDIVRNRFHGSRNATNELKTFALITFGYLVAIAGAAAFISAKASIPSLANFNVQFEAMDYAFLGLFYYLAGTFKLEQSKTRQDLLSTSLISKSARRFVSRHNTMETNWAATAGIRAPSFILNVDPDATISHVLPASLTQIRNSEIQRCLDELLGKEMLAKSLHGSQIHGYIDPESSVRPCIDLLCAFASLTLDAGPLVEKRLGGLVNLLPILEPQLAGLVQTNKLKKALSQTHWLFYFDYGWIDQFISKSSNSTRYDVMHHNYNQQLHSQMEELFKRRHQMGNFVWLSERSRERLVFEAPMLANIIQALPIRTADGEEQLTFIIRFEELIPRLQSYFQLDQRRLALREFEPSIEGRRFLHVMQLQIANLTDKEQIIKLLQSISSYPWAGFREKDDAQLTLVKLYEKSVQLLSQSEDSADVIAKSIEEMREKFVETAIAVGYPSQILHTASREKFSFRQAQSIIELANKPWEPRFEESWALMASLEAHRYSERDLVLFLNFIASMPSHKAINRNVYVIAKAIESVANIGQAAKADQANFVEAALNSLGAWMLGLNVTPDLLARYLDAALFLERTLGTVSLSGEVVSGIDHFIAKCSSAAADDRSRASLDALLKRWQIRDSSLQRVS